jgi:lactoylglutathione lyase
VLIAHAPRSHGTEKDAAFKHATGNEEGRRGFGHLGFLVPDVYATTAALQARGAEFSKLPDAGSMKGLAFAKDPVRFCVRA